MKGARVAPFASSTGTSSVDGACGKAGCIRRECVVKGARSLESFYRGACKLSWDIENCPRAFSRSRAFSGVIIRPTSLSSVTGGMLAALGHRPSLDDEDLCLTGRKVKNIAFAAVGHVDSVELVGELLGEPDFHGRKETSN